MNQSLLAIVVVAVVLLGVLFLASKLSKPRLNKSHFAKHWEKIEHETNAVAALIAADSLVDQALKHAQVRGDTMGERLNNGAGFLRDINGVWSAHKLRNRVVHEPGTHLSQADSERALRQFKKALKDLGAL